MPKPEDLQERAADSPPGRAKILVTLESLEEDRRTMRAQGLDLFGFPLGPANMWEEEAAPPVRRELLGPFLRGELDLKTDALVSFLVRYYPNTWGEASSEVLKEISEKEGQ